MEYYTILDNTANTFLTSYLLYTITFSSLSASAAVIDYSNLQNPVASLLLRLLACGFYFYTLAIFPNPNPTWNPSLVAFQTWNPGLAKRFRIPITGVHPPVLHVAGRTRSVASVVVVIVVVVVLVVVVVAAVVVDVVVLGVVLVVVVVAVVLVVGGGQVVRWQEAWWCGRVSESHELSSTRTPDDRRQLTTRCCTPRPHVTEH